MSSAPAGKKRQVILVKNSEEQKGSGLELVTPSAQVVEMATTKNKGIKRKKPGRKSHLPAKRRRVNKKNKRGRKRSTRKRKVTGKRKR